MDIQELIGHQRQAFSEGKTRPLSVRIEALKKLREAIQQQESSIVDALKADLNKSAFESYMSEIGIVLEEISCQIKHLKRWAKPKKVKTPLAQFSAKSFQTAEPYGVVLIMSPWNYPFQLSLVPLAGAIAAGNCVIVKPSAYAPATSKVIADILESCFPKEYVAVVQGGRKENQQLLEQKFDYIFFTGGAEVGKLVMKSAAKHLTPVSLELGGKSPCIVDRTADLKLAAKRIVFGKILNSGQTCVAPDYLFVDEKVKEEFIGYLQEYIQQFLGENPLKNPDYPKIITEKHFDRLCKLMEEEAVRWGGKSCRDTLTIEPTILDNITPQSPVMQQEIFGPLLPIMTFHTLEEAINYINSCPKPLACYLFTKDKEAERKVLEQVSFGGGCINDTIIHLATTKMGFGGVGESGMGSYHGKASFDTFSHYKSIVKKANWIDLPMRYHPYSPFYEKAIRMFLR